MYCGGGCHCASQSNRLAYCACFEERGGLFLRLAPVKVIVRVTVKGSQPSLLILADQQPENASKNKKVDASGENKTDRQSNITGACLLGGTERQRVSCFLLLLLQSAEVVCVLGKVDFLERLFVSVFFFWWNLVVKYIKAVLTDRELTVSECNRRGSVGVGKCRSWSNFAQCVNYLAFHSQSDELESLLQLIVTHPHKLPNSNHVTLDREMGAIFLVPGI